MMKYYLLLFLFCSAALLKAQAKTQPLAIGEIKTIHSDVLNEERILNIYLPAHFNKEKKYPVIYLLDGSIDEDILHVAGLTQFFNLMYEMPESIVVGIANVDRKRDFTFHTESESLKNDYPTTGHSDKFISFIKDELQPFVESNYKTDSAKYLIGQSLGGLLATEILLKNPDLFTHYLITSPSLWWDDESLLKNAIGLLNKKHKNVKFVYIGVGNKEDEIMIREAKELFEILNQSSFKPKKLEYNELPETHATILHYSLIDAFKILFKEKY